MARPANPPALSNAVPPAAISGAHDFFEERASRRSLDSLSGTGSIRLPLADPRRRQRLMRIVKITMGVVVAIGAIALVRVAIEDTSSSDAAPAGPSQPSQ